MTGYVDHHAWLVENNLLTDQMQDTIAMGAFCLVEGTLNAETFIDFNQKTVFYKLMLEPRLYENLKLLEKFEAGEEIGFFESMRLKKFIKSKKEADNTGMGYRLKDIGDKFIKAYLTPEWEVSVEISKDFKNEGEDFWICGEENQSSD